MGATLHDRDGDATDQLQQLFAGLAYSHFRDTADRSTFYSIKACTGIISQHPTNRRLDVIDYGQVLCIVA